MDSHSPRRHVRQEHSTLSDDARTDHSAPCEHDCGGGECHDNDDDDDDDDNHDDDNDDRAVAAAALSLGGTVITDSKLTTTATTMAATHVSAAAVGPAAASITTTTTMAAVESKDPMATTAPPDRRGSIQRNARVCVDRGDAPRLPPPPPSQLLPRTLRPSNLPSSLCTLSDSNKTRKTAKTTTTTESNTMTIMMMALADGHDYGHERGGDGDVQAYESDDVDDAPLPPGWFAYTDPGSGRTYYAHAATGRSSWVVPPPAPPPPPLPPPPSHPTAVGAATAAPADRLDTNQSSRAHRGRLCRPVARLSAGGDATVASNNSDKFVEVEKMSVEKEEDCHPGNSSTRRRRIIAPPYSSLTTSNGELYRDLEDYDHDYDDDESETSASTSAASGSRGRCPRRGLRSIRVRRRDRDYGGGGEYYDDNDDDDGRSSTSSYLVHRAKRASGQSSSHDECGGALRRLPGRTSAEAKMGREDEYYCYYYDDDDDASDRTGRGRVNNAGDGAAAAAAASTSLATARTCGSCGLDKVRSDYSSVQWKRRIGTGRCLTCSEAAEQESERSRVENRKICGQCQTGRTKEEYSLTQWRKAEGTGKCTSCVQEECERRKSEEEAATKTCGTCKTGKVQSEYSVNQWRRAVGTGRCLACTEAEEESRNRACSAKKCGTCGKPKSSDEYSLSQWSKVAGMGRCKVCVQADMDARSERCSTKRCGGCGEAKGPTEYSLNQWKRAVGTGTCLSCTSTGAAATAAAATATVRRRCARCKKKKPLSDFAPSRPGGNNNDDKNSVGDVNCLACCAESVEGTAAAAARARHVPTRLCNACGVKKHPEEFTLEQWKARTGLHRCIACLNDVVLLPTMGNAELSVETLSATSTFPLRLPQERWGLGMGMGATETFSFGAVAEATGIRMPALGAPSAGLAEEARRIGRAAAAGGSLSMRPAEEVAVSVAENALLDDSDLWELQKSYTLAMKNESARVAQALLCSDERVPDDEPSRDVLDPRSRSVALPTSSSDSNDASGIAQSVNAVRSEVAYSPDPASPSAQGTTLFRLTDGTSSTGEHVSEDAVTHEQSTPVMKVCCSCGAGKALGEYTETQWKKEVGLGRCRSCEDADSYPSKRSSVEGLDLEPASVSLPIVADTIGPRIAFVANHADIGALVGEYIIVYYHSRSAGDTEQYETMGTLSLVEAAGKTMTTSAAAGAPPAEVSRELGGTVRMPRPECECIGLTKGDFMFETCLINACNRKRYHVDPKKFRVDGSIPIRVAEFPSPLLKAEFQNLDDQCLGSLRVVSAFNPAGCRDGELPGECCIAEEFALNEGDLWIHIDWTLDYRFPCESFLIARKREPELGMERSSNSLMDLGMDSA